MQTSFDSGYHQDTIKTLYSKIDLPRTGLSIISGLLLTASFPNIGLSIMAWFALIPMLFAVRGLSGFGGFRLGLLTGFIHYQTLSYWLFHTMNTYGGLPWFLSIPIMVLISLYLALYIGVFSACLCTFARKPVICLLMIPFLWVVLEYIRTYFLSGLPWALLGYSQYKILPLIQISDVTGVYGVSFIIAAVNGMLFMGTLTYFKRIWFGQEVTKPLSITAVTSGIVLLGIVWHYGVLRLEQINQLIAQSPKAVITAIQGNIDQSQKWDLRFQKYVTQKYIDLSVKTQPEKSELIVWPETATPFYLTYDKPLTRMVVDGIKTAGCDFLIGSPSFAYDNSKVRYYNSAFLVRSTGTVDGKYDKAHLVPFGEYVPLKKWLPFMGKIVEHVGDFQAGKKGETLLWGNTRLGILICFEIIFPDLSRIATDHGARLLINLTNDAWYGKTSAPYQHFSMSIFRAVENRRALVRSANTGISGFIDPVGKSYGETDIYIHATSTQSVALLKTKSLYTRFGDVFAWICIAVTVLLAGIGSLKRTK